MQKYRILDIAIIESLLSITIIAYKNKEFQYHQFIMTMKISLGGRGE
jgi:hypothetical protein